MDKLLKLERENSELKTQLQKYKDGLFLKETFLKQAIASPCLIIEVNEHLKLEYVSNLSFEPFEVTEKEIMGMSVLNFIQAKDHKRLLADVQNLFQGDYGIPKMYGGRNSSGKLFDIIVLSAPVLTQDQKVRIRSTLIKCDNNTARLFQNTKSRLVQIGDAIGKTVKNDMDNIETDEMVIYSQKMKDILKVIDVIKDIPSTVLVTGESGTGKELIAKQIHNRSERRKKPFIAINCGALPENLLESELFGYEAGAFTGAQKRKKGKFELAQGGTLFLDEVGEMSLTMQTKLLRVLQDKIVTPLGSEQDVKVDTRIILATNRDLKNLVAIGEFREDLFYRIKTLHITAPSLRDRIEEIPSLCNFFISKFNALFNKQIRDIDPTVLTLFQNYSFPGNIRELQHIIEYATIFCQNKTIMHEDLPEELLANMRVAPSFKADDTALGEKEQLIEAIIHAGGNRTLAARRLGMHKTTLYRKLKNFNITNEMLIGSVN